MLQSGFTLKYNRLVKEHSDVFGQQQKSFWYEKRAFNPVSIFMRII